jgi:hypothetical protein
MLAVPVAPARAQSTAGAPPAAATHSARDGQRDFDFEIGSWKTHLLLREPLNASAAWTEYAGTSIVTKVWGGHANLVELDVEGPRGRIVGLSLRLYNPQARQWSLNFSNARVGTLSKPVLGEFKDGRGEFLGLEEHEGRAVLVRFIITPVTADSVRFEQSYSDDWGRSWVPNWIATDTRMHQRTGRR